MGDIINVAYENWYIWEDVNKIGLSAPLDRLWLMGTKWIEIFFLLRSHSGAIDHKHRWVAYNWIVARKWYQELKGHVEFWQKTWGHSLHGVSAKLQKNYSQEGIHEKSSPIPIIKLDNSQ